MSKTRKFILSLDEKVYKSVEKIALDRGVSVQSLIRAIIIPEWLNDYKSRYYEKSSRQYQGKW